MKTIRIGTRSSALALWQANFISDELRRVVPEVEIQLIKINTQGDRDQRSSLTQIGGQGVFTKTIEDALLNNEIDVAVHSLKDLPSTMTGGLTLCAVPQRGPVADVFIGREIIRIEDLPQNATVASGSIRRRSQLLNWRPDLNIVDLRGNIQTRLQKLETQNLDGIIMAQAALVRLELKQVEFQVIDLEKMTPAVGQGAVGVQTRTGDESINRLVGKISHDETFSAVSAERAFLAELDSGCQFPVGAYATVDGQTLNITGYVGSEDGRTILRDNLTSPVAAAQNAGKQLAELLISRGAKDLLMGLQ